MHAFLRALCRMSGHNEAERSAGIAATLDLAAKLYDCLDIHRAQNSGASRRTKPSRYGFTPIRMLSGQLTRCNASGSPHTGLKLASRAAAGSTPWRSA